MAKQQTCQRFIYKINSSRLRKAKWNLTLPLSEARANKEIISLIDSTMLRFIDELNGLVDADERAKQIKLKIRKIRRLSTSKKNKKLIKELYSQLDEVQFKPDYMCLIIDKIRDYRRASLKKGFKINDVKYIRLLGTNGGVKNETIVYVSEKHATELKKRLENGRNPLIKRVPAKLESYKALTCSGSIPVSNPKGLLVVSDCEMKFLANVINIDDKDENDKYLSKPKLTYHENQEVELNDSDGYGLILPELSEKWTLELKEKGTSSGFCVRNAWCKGMVFTFDYLDFADKIAESKYMVTDAWGDDVDIRTVQMIITTSMLKLWDSYSSCKDYLDCCEKNHYTFSVTKCCPEELENERNLNYQFIQSFNLDDNQIDELIKPTVEELKEVLGGDYRKSILFLKGMFLNDDNVGFAECDFAKALMVNKTMINDPFVESRIHQMIKKRINEAKVGVVKVHSNFSIVSGDPYSLCQHIFGLDVTGLLKAGESYNKYWIDSCADKVACFRAPMTCHNNVRLLRMANTDDMKYWYQYMKTVTIFNSWDTAAHALNGLDKDSDSVLLTDNSIIVNNVRELPAIICVQRKAETTVVTEADLIEANINSFGDEIGTTTNRITTTFDVQSKFQPESEEYKELDYRIMCGQLFQQNAIDKTKGILAQPMPKEWYNRSVNKILPTDTEDVKKLKEFNMSIIADKKPYFMCYIYSQTMAEYKRYIDRTNRKAIREFRLTMKELLDKPNKTKTEKEFIQYYYDFMPVGIHNCVVNRICWKFEDIFDGYFKKQEDQLDFDYSILKSNVEYSKTCYNQIKKEYDIYSQRLGEFQAKVKREHTDPVDITTERNIFKQNFKQRCLGICSSEDELCDIVLDMCYSTNNSKQFAWDICGNVIVKNLLKLSDYKIHYPVKCDDGNINFGGHKFKMEEKVIGDDNK